MDGIPVPTKSFICEFFICFHFFLIVYHFKLINFCVSATKDWLVFFEEWLFAVLETFQRAVTMKSIELMIIGIKQVLNFIIAPNWVKSKSAFYV